MDPNQIVAYVSERKWVPLAALVIGLVVRLLKSDTKIPVDVPPRARFWLALALGAASGVLEHVASGQAWTPALAGGLVSAALAVLGQNAVVDSIRGGREIPVPLLTVPGASPSPGKPPSIPPKAGPPAAPPLLVLLLAGGLVLGGLRLGPLPSTRVDAPPALLAGCTKQQALNLAELLAEKTLCAVQNQDLPNDQIVAKCAVAPGDAEKILSIVGEARRKSAEAADRAAARRCDPAPAAPDGGAW